MNHSSRAGVRRPIESGVRLGLKYVLIAIAVGLTLVMIGTIEIETYAVIGPIISFCIGFIMGSLVTPVLNKNREEISSWGRNTIKNLKSFRD